MVHINLLPLKVRKTKVVLRLYTYIIIASSMAAIVLILMLLNIMAQTKRLEGKIAGLKATEETLAEKTRPLLGLADQEKKIAALKVMVAELTQEQPVWIKILDELADRVQGDMWLTKIQSMHNEKSRVLALTLEGEAYNKLSVADFLSALENSTLFKNVSLEALNETDVEHKTLVQFKLKLEYAGILAPQPATAGSGGKSK